MPWDPVVRWKFLFFFSFFIEMKNPTRFSNKTSTHDLMRRIRFWRIKSLEQDFKYLFLKRLNFATIGVNPSSCIARSKGWCPSVILRFRPTMSDRRPWSGFWPQVVRSPSFSTYLSLSCSRPHIGSICARGSCRLKKLIR